jgi:hypothetical protein
MQFPHTSRYQLAGTTEPIKERSAELVAATSCKG